MNYAVRTAVSFGNAARAIKDKVNGTRSVHLGPPAFVILFVMCAGLIGAFGYFPQFKTHAAYDDAAQRGKDRELPRLRETLNNLQLGFEANRGQTDKRVKFLSRGAGYTLFLTSTGAVLALQRGDQSQIGEQKKIINDVLRMQLVGANQKAELEGLDQLPGRSNYYIGRDPKHWQTNIPLFATIHYKEVYKGIDLIYYGNQGQLENDFIISGGADPGRIKLSFNGVQEMSVDNDGELLLKTAGGEVRLRKPTAYQDIDGDRHKIDVRYELAGEKGSLVGFEVGDFNHNKPLVIDPVLIYSTFLGGSSSDSGTGIALDPSGNAYITGSTSSTNFPAVNSIQPYTGQQSGFITKINAAGTALVYSTYLGGTGNGNTTNLYDIAVDSAGNAYATGHTFATDYPTTPANAFQPTKPASTSTTNAVVTRLNPGGTLSYSTFLGSNQGSRAFGIATDGAGNAYVVGSPATGFPTTANAFNTSQPSTGYLSKIDTNASGQASLVYSTFLGPAFGGSTPTAIAVDAAGNAYMAGNATSGSNGTGFTTAGAFLTAYQGGTRDVFVAKFNTTASGNASRIYCTYLGGSGDDTSANGLFTVDSSKIAIDAGGNAYVIGTTDSTNFPTQNPYQVSKGGTTKNAFLTKVNATGSGLVYSTYFGGTSSGTGDVGLGVAVNLVGNAYVTGLASSANFPTQNPIVPVQATGDIFVAKFTPAGNALVYSTRMAGSSGQAWGHGIALDGAGNAYVTGNTRAGLPTTNGAFQTTLGGLDDAFSSVIADPTIIGRVVDEDNNPIAGASVSLTGVPSGATTTDANGFFTFGLLTVGNNYTVSVSVPNYIFNPQNANNLQKNVRLDFSPVVQTISGQVTLGPNGFPAVTMTLSGGKSLSTQTDGSGNYVFANLPAGRTYLVTPSKAGFGFQPASQNFPNLLANQIANFIALPNVQFTVGSFMANEADGKATITVVRTSGDSGPASIDYETSDQTAIQRVHYSIAIGTLNFATGETMKSFDVLIVNEGYVEGNHTFLVTLSNPVGATIGTPNPTQITITDDDNAPAASNPIDDARYFVQLHYYDFLSRFPDQGGWDYWTGQITQCGANVQCTRTKRVDVSNAFFYEQEYQQTGAYVFRLYRAAYGNTQPTPNPDNSNPVEAAKIPSYATFVRDRARVLGGSSLAQAQLFLANLFVQRQEFLNKYPGNLTLDQFVDAVLANILAADGVNLSSQRNALIALGSRGAVMYRLADDNQTNPISNGLFVDAEYNRSFVFGEYSGYLRRDSDIGGFQFWLTQVSRGPLRDGNTQHAMVCSFTTSAEYQQRFAQTVSHNNTECPQ